MTNQFVSFCLCCLYVALSIGLISFNKYLMHAERFPFPIPLATLHTANSWICSLALYKLSPALFPSISATEGKQRLLLSYFMPIAAFFVTGIVCSNWAYIYCSVAFLQFMKQANIAVIFCVSCLMGSQSFDRLKLTLVIVIVGGTTTAVHGELHFVLTGFIIQAFSQLGECGKNAMQEWVLSGSQMKLDPLTYILFMSPSSLVILLVANCVSWNPAVSLQAVDWWRYLLPNAMCAFALNITIAVLIKQTSAMAFMLCGVVKDILIVVSSSYMFGDSLAHQQVFGFSMSITGILLWSCAKVQPDHPVIRRLASMLHMEVVDDKAKAEQEEMKPLLQEEVDAADMDEDIR